MSQTNWEILCAKLGKKTTDQKNKVQKQPKKEQPKPTIRSTAQLPSCQPDASNVKLLSPLAYALWSTNPGENIKVSSGTELKQVTFSDSRKLSIGKYIAIDCEFVGVGHDDRSALARVSVVNMYGVAILDEYVRPKEWVTAWRTWVSGVRPQHMKTAILFEEAQSKVRELLEDRILVGHAVRNDLKALQLELPPERIRDSSKIAEYRKMSNGSTPSLRKLSKVILGIDIQNGQHSSIEDAQATMALFRLQHTQSKTSNESVRGAARRKTRNQKKK